MILHYLYNLFFPKQIEILSDEEADQVNAEAIREDWEAVIGKW